MGARAEFCMVYTLWVQQCWKYTLPVTVQPLGSRVAGKCTRHQSSAVMHYFVEVTLSSVGPWHDPRAFLPQDEELSCDNNALVL